MFISRTRELLTKLIDAERNGKPLTATDLGSELRGSTFEDAWASGHIDQDANGAAIVSPSGKLWLEQNQEPKRGAF